MDTEQRFIELIEHHKRIIYKVCYVYAPGRGQIDDYFQEVVLALWPGIPRFPGREQNCHVGIPHRVVYLHFVCPPPDAASAKRAPFGRPGVRRRYAGPRAARRAVCGDLTLGPARPALILLWLEERPAGEIAAITGLSPGNVAVKLTRIRCKLRKMYNR